MLERTATIGGTIEWLSRRRRRHEVRLVVPRLADAGTDDDADVDELAA